MKRNCIFLGWNRPVTGREAGSMELFKSVTNYLKEKADKGVIEDYKPVILDTHGGDLNGFILIEGDHDKLHTLRNEDEFTELMMNCSFHLQEFGQLWGFCEDEVDEVMDNYGDLVKRYGDK